MLAVMMQASHRGRGGRRQQAAGSECAALFSFSKGMAHVSKHVVNAQVSTSWGPELQQPGRLGSESGRLW